MRSCDDNKKEEKCTKEGKSTLPSVSSATRHNLNDMRLRNQLTDVILSAQNNVQFSAHRAILASCSPFFRALFTNGFAESNKYTIELDNVPSAILEEILQYAYLRVAYITEDNVADLFHWSDYLDIPKLRDLCASYLKSHLTQENCIAIWSTARDRSHKSLEKAAWTFILRHFEEIMENNKELMDLSAPVLSRLLSADELNVSNEGNVWRCLKDWLEKDYECRSKEFVPLLAKVRVGCVNSEVLADMASSIFVKSNEEMEAVVASSVKLQHGFPLDSQELLRLMESRACRPRLPSQLLLAIGGWSGQSPTSAVESFDVRSGRWTELPFKDPAGARAYHGVVQVDDNVYMCGGFNGQQYFNSLRVFDTVLKKWDERGPMNQRRCYVGITAIGNKIFAMGGFNGMVRVNSCECYDIHTNQWSVITPMHYQRSDSHATVVGDKIYMCGGFNGQECIESAECLDVPSGRWTPIRRMTSQRSGIGVASLNGVIYAVGGFNGTERLASAEMYDHRADRWDSLSVMHSKRSNFAIEAIEGKIYVAGGFNGAGTISEAECFEPRMNSWTRIASMNVNRSALYMCRLDGVSQIGDFLGSSRDFSGAVHIRRFGT